MKVEAQAGTCVPRTCKLDDGSSLVAVFSTTHGCRVSPPVNHLFPYLQLRLVHIISRLSRDPARLPLVVEPGKQLNLRCRHSVVGRACAVMVSPKISCTGVMLTPLPS
jgi:hypothetical protein